MEFLRPHSWSEALAMAAEHPQARVISGGTDVMVEINFGHSRPWGLLDLTGIAELTEWSADGDFVRIGSGVTYTRIAQELRTTVPGLAMASRTVGSPMIRNRGTVAGNLGAASPAGDSHPILLATDAVVEVESTRGSREIAIGDFFTGVKRNALADDELIAAVRVPRPTGPQQYSKIGTRNAMVIAVAAFAVALHPDQRRVGTGMGSVAPTPRRATEAEAFLAGALAEADAWDKRPELPARLVSRFGELAAAAASPIDDVRATAAYRRHSVNVMARRTLTWAWTAYRKES